MLPEEFSLSLLHHPATPAPVVRTIEAHAAWTDEGQLELAYRLRGDMSRLSLPEPDRFGRADGLWEHTCFEAFVGLVGDTAYREFNFSPSGQWASYSFSDYRRPDECPLVVPPPEFSVRSTAGRLEVVVRLAAEALPIADGSALQLGLAAVVESIDTVDGSFSYWALRHPEALPDFHHRNGFALELPAPSKAK